MDCLKPLSYVSALRPYFEEPVSYVSSWFNFTVRHLRSKHVADIFTQAVARGKCYECRQAIPEGDVALKVIKTQKAEERFYLHPACAEPAF